MFFGNVYVLFWIYVYVEGNRKCFFICILNGFIGSYVDVFIKNFFKG